MVTKSQIKQIKQLKFKKFREKTGLFVAEGEKVVLELLQANFGFHYIFSTIKNFDFDSVKISNDQMKKITHFKNSSNYLGVFIKPTYNYKILNESEKIVALDHVSDPGNLGTIIRTCDWYGVKHIICSRNSVDCFNSKVVQASMGSISRVFCYYLDLPNYLKKSNHMIYGTDLKSRSIYDTSFKKKSVFVFGNESNGISNKVINITDEQISIPKKNKVVNSLNIASSVSILLAENFRQNKKAIRK